MRSLSGLLQDHLGYVRLADFKFIPQSNEVKVFEVVGICDDLESFLSIKIHYILVEFDYLEFVTLLSGGIVDLTEVSFLIGWGKVFRDGSWHHFFLLCEVMLQFPNVLICTSGGQEFSFLLLFSIYPTWFVNLKGKDRT